MEVLVKAVVRDYKLRSPASSYILDSSHYRIKCRVLESDFRITFFGKSIFKLKLTGEEDEIRKFISYLKLNDFDVTIY